MNPFDENGKYTLPLTPQQQAVADFFDGETDESLFTTLMEDVTLLPVIANHRYPDLLDMIAEPTALLCAATPNFIHVNMPTKRFVAGVEYKVTYKSNLLLSALMYLAHLRGEEFSTLTGKLIKIGADEMSNVVGDELQYFYQVDPKHPAECMLLAGIRHFAMDLKYKPH